MTKRLKPDTRNTLPHGNASQVGGCSGIRNSGRTGLSPSLLEVNYTARLSDVAG